MAIAVGVAIGMAVGVVHGGGAGERPADAAVEFLGVIIGLGFQAAEAGFDGADDAFLDRRGRQPVSAPWNG